MRQDHRPSDLQLMFRNLRWLIAGFKAWRNPQGLPFRQAMEQLGHSADGPNAAPPRQSPESSSPAVDVGRAGLAQQAAELLKRQAEARAALRPQGAATALPAPVREAMAKGQKIEAIRLLRAQTGLGLKEAKDAVEADADTAPASTPSAASAAGPAAATHLAPGEVPASGSTLWLWVVAALVIAGIYLYLS